MRNGMGMFRDFGKAMDRRAVIRFSGCLGSAFALCLLPISGVRGGTGTEKEALPERVDRGLVLAACGGGEIRPFRTAEAEAGAAVVIFVTTDCPIANRYAPEIERIRRDYAERGVSLTLIHVDAKLSDEEALAHAREFGLGAGLAVDREHLAVQAAGARVTPEAVVVDPVGRIRYRGRIDDQFADYGARRVQPLRRDLREAIEDLLAGREVAVSETEAIGCHIPTLASGENIAPAPPER